MTERDSMWCDSCGSYHSEPAGVGMTCRFTEAMDSIEAQRAEQR